MRAKETTKPPRTRGTRTPQTTRRFQAMPSRAGRNNYAEPKHYLHNGDGKEQWRNRARYPSQQGLNRPGTRQHSRAHLRRGNRAAHRHHRRRCRTRQVQPCQGRTRYQHQGRQHRSRRQRARRRHRHRQGSALRRCPAVWRHAIGKGRTRTPTTKGRADLKPQEKSMLAEPDDNNKEDIVLPSRTSPE